MSTVLVVDDSPVIRELMVEHLQSTGLTVKVAVNGADAQTKISASPPDLVITDIIMPEMNGYELCRWIKSEAQTQSIPVIMCTSKDEEFDVYWGNKQGADAYVTKPFKPNELIRTIKQLLKNPVS
ncbi:MAG: response regulator [Cyanobacteria bacterium J06639_1]